MITKDLIPIREQLERIEKKILSLTIYPELTISKQKIICNQIIRFYEKK